jgi:hypothetical protein
LPVITISRQMGSLGDDVAEILARRLGWELIGRETLLQKFFSPAVGARELHLLRESAKFYLSPMSDGVSYLDFLKTSLDGYLKDNSAVLMGFGSQILFAGHPGAIHVRIEAPQRIRLGRVRRRFQVPRKDAATILDTAEKKHKRFVSLVYQADLTRRELYDLVLNTQRLSPDECAAAILALWQEQDLSRRLKLQNEKADAIANEGQYTPLKNETELEFARILDSYQIQWRYEPTTFPIEWDAEGNVTMAFSPDFYLPEFNTYIELTSMNQKYVTIKNRKIKRVRELYPGTNVKIVFKKDFQALVERFGSAGGESL